MNHLPVSRNYNRMLVIKRERSPIYFAYTVLFVGDYNGGSLAEKRKKVLRDYGKRLFRTYTANCFAEEGEEYGSIIVDGAYRTDFNDDVSVGETIVLHDYRNEKVWDVVLAIKHDTLGKLRRSDIVARLENAISNERK